MKRLIKKSIINHRISKEFNNISITSHRSNEEFNNKFNIINNINEDFNKKSLTYRRISEAFDYKSIMKAGSLDIWKDFEKTVGQIHTLPRFGFSGVSS